MNPVLIIEPHDEVAAAFQDAVSSARYTPIVRRHLDRLSDLRVRPLTILLRVGHADVSKLPADRPPIVAFVSSDADVAEAARLRCEVVLRTPDEVRRLYDVLRSLASGCPQRHE